ncbi:MAG: hypothetical protein A2Y40_00220 [Candidatus Margulisbacteria bacterium GWF2_35_9]|nr:MAG: hypothetical protein A2Y40_00220 [Candidatus Margulisbacteria bacterium GWF2_35_9]
MKLLVVKVYVMKIYKIVILTLLLMGVIFWVYAGFLNIPIGHSNKNLDSDGDGIPNYLDASPDTPAGARVDPMGNFLSISLNINFETNSSEISTSYKKDLKDFAVYLKKHENEICLIRGYTDDEIGPGFHDNNLDLSFRRAASVAKALTVWYGVSANQISVIGFGSKEPEVINNSDENRAINRRIEAVLVK